MGEVVVRRQSTSAASKDAAVGIALALTDRREAMRSRGVCGAARGKGDDDVDLLLRCAFVGATLT